MNVKSVSRAAALFLLCAASNANALGISLIALSDTDLLLVGDVILVDVVMDFSAEPTLGGGFNIAYDSDVLELVDFESFNIGSFSNRDPDFSDGLLSSWAFADFLGLAGPLAVGSLAFEVLAGPVGGSIDLWEDTGGIGGSFTSAVTFLPYEAGQLTFESLSYQVGFPPVPVPAAVWCMLSGLGVLVGFRRRRSM